MCLCRFGSQVGRTAQEKSSHARLFFSFCMTEEKERNKKKTETEVLPSGGRAVGRQEYENCVFESSSEGEKVKQPRYSRQSKLCVATSSLMPLRDRASTLMSKKVEENVFFINTARKEK